MNLMIVFSITWKVNTIESDIAEIEQEMCRQTNIIIFAWIDDNQNCNAALNCFNFINKNKFRHEI